MFMQMLMLVVGYIGPEGEGPCHEEESQITFINPVRPEPYRALVIVARDMDGTIDPN